MEAPYEIWLISQVVSEEMFKECGRQTEAYLSNKFTSEPSLWLLKLFILLNYLCAMFKQRESINRKIIRFNDSMWEK